MVEQILLVLISCVPVFCLFTGTKGMNDRRYCFVAVGTVRNSLFYAAGDRKGMHKAEPLATGHNLRMCKALSSRPRESTKDGTTIYFCSQMRFVAQLC